MTLLWICATALWGAARNDAGLTQEQLSDLSQVSIKHIANIEKGEMNPSYEVLRALLTVLKIK